MKLKQQYDVKISQYQTQTSWTPMEVEKNPFSKRTVAQLNQRGGLLGVNPKQSSLDKLFNIFGSQLFKYIGQFKRDFFSTSQTPKSSSIRIFMIILRLESSLPSSYNVRTEYPHCDFIIKDQGYCGSCWSHAASQMLAQRFCIQSDGEIQVDLSRQDMVSCDFIDTGCNGGYLSSSIQYLMTEGIVTEDCMDYTSYYGDVYACQYRCDSKDTPYIKYGCKYNLKIYKFICNFIIL